jgi:hypothetical protein
MDERDNYGYGYSPAGERFCDLKSGRRQGRINMIAGYRDSQLIAPFTVEGACNRTVGLLPRKIRQPSEKPDFSRQVLKPRKSVVFSTALLSIVID